MAVKIRLARHGAKKRPYYRLIAADARARRDGRFLEHIGSYDPTVEPPAVSLKRDRVRYWLDQGAQPTGTAQKLIARYLDAEDSVPQPKPRKAPAPAAEKVSEAPAPKPAPKPAAAEVAVARAEAPAAQAAPAEEAAAPAEEAAAPAEEAAAPAEAPAAD